jgi:non-ribosomal peptide synthetase component F
LCIPSFTSFTRVIDNLSARRTFHSEPEIKIFMDHFGTTLESIFQNLAHPLRDVNLVSSEERQRIIVEMNPLYPAETSLSLANNVAELIEEQAHKTPQRIAVIRA